MKFKDSKVLARVFLVGLTVGQAGWRDINNQKEVLIKTMHIKY